MRISRRLFLGQLAAAGLTRAQDPVFSADSRVVTLYASVRDAAGKLIPDLNQEDFELTDDGKPVEIRYFSREADLPLTIGLMIDTSASQFSVLERERRGAYAFLERIIRPDRDKAFVMKFDVRVATLCPPTADLPALRKGLREADLPLKPHVSAKARIEPKRGDILTGTKLQNSVKQASVRFMATTAGRKALLMFTDGVDAGSKTTLQEAVEAAQRSETQVFSILYADHQRMPPGLQKAQDTKGRHILTELATHTGGGFFSVSPDHPLEQILDEIEAELRTQYSIGFVPKLTTSGEYRKLGLRVRNGALAVRSRDGYYAK